MKKTVVLIAAVLFAAGYLAQAKPKEEAPKEHPYVFTTVKENPITSVKNQFRSGTCWCYSTLGFIESEVIRIKGDAYKDIDLSEMFVVGKSYFDKGVKFVRMDGDQGYGDGSSSEDVLHVIADYGLVPQSAYSGMNYGYELPVQAEMMAAINGYLRAIAKVPNKNLSTAWKAGLQGILDAYLGAAPTTFTVNGVEFTPESYRDALGIVPSDYISLASFSHHPFYKEFVLEVSDNWRWDASWNLPIEELMAVIDNAVEQGYTIAWGTDVSEKGFTRNGIALIVADEDINKKSGSDQEHWTGKGPAPKPGQLVDTWEQVTQEARQEGYDRKELTDDHGMQIYGIAKDQYGHKFYMVKNSWGDRGEYKGIWYASETFVAAKTMNILVHKDAIPAAIREKLGL